MRLRYPRLIHEGFCLLERFFFVVSPFWISWCWVMGWNPPTLTYDIEFSVAKSTSTTKASPFARIKNHHFLYPFRRCYKLEKCLLWVRLNIHHPHETLKWWFFGQPTEKLCRLKGFCQGKKQIVECCKLGTVFENSQRTLENCIWKKKCV